MIGNVKLFLKEYEKDDHQGTKAQSRFVNLGVFVSWWLKKRGKQ